MNDGPLSDRVALLVGAGRGIGAASARALVQLGARVCLVARSGSDVSKICDEISAAGGEALPAVLDIADDAATERIVRECLKGFGRLDFVLNFAAATGPLGRPLWLLSQKDWAQTVAVNLNGPFNLVRAVLPTMIEQGFGRLIFASSPFGDRATRGIGAYGSSRAGVNYLSMQLANEVRDTEIASCLVYPGVTDTQGLKSFQAAFGQNSQAEVLRRGQRTAESAETMAGLFAWICLQPARKVNGLVFAWSDANVRRAVENLQRQMPKTGA